MNCSHRWIQSSSTWSIDGHRQRQLGLLYLLIGIERSKALHQHRSCADPRVRNKADQSVKADVDFDVIELRENGVSHSDAELSHLGSSAEDEQPSLFLDVYVPNAVWR